jgi:hypothetical protein
MESKNSKRAVHWEWEEKTRGEEKEILQREQNI